jgi:hypothetical protein
VDELDLTDNIRFGKPSDLSLSYRVHRLVAGNCLKCALHRRNHRLAAMRFLIKRWSCSTILFK